MIYKESTRIPYGRQSITERDVEAVAGVLRSDYITQGPKVSAFERALSLYHGTRYAVAVSSGTAALHLACLAIGVKEKDKVVTSPITFAASANCVLYCGGEPHFVDVQPDTVNLDPDKLAYYAKHKKMKAVIPVHFAGHPADMKEIRRIADRYGLGIIEDAAHALGAVYDGSKVGSCKYSDVTTLSFHPIKHITTGEGGAILTNNKLIYERVMRLRHHGIIRGHGWRYDIVRPGFNYRITDFQCALGSSQLKRLERYVRARRKLAANYRARLSDLEEIRLPEERKGKRSSYHLFVIRVLNNKRDRLYRYLRENNILTQVNYVPVYMFSFYRRRFGYKPDGFPVAEEYFKECLSIPMYASLSEADQNKIIQKIRGFFKK